MAQFNVKNTVLITMDQNLVDLLRDKFLIYHDVIDNGDKKTVILLFS